MRLHLPVRRFMILSAIIFSVYTLQSCSTIRIVTKYDCDTFANNPVNRKTLWTYAWGLVQPKDINPKCDSRSNHMNKVAVKDNLGFSLISVITLGIVMPHRIEWCCAPYTPPAGTLGSDK